MVKSMNVWQRLLKQWEGKEHLIKKQQEEALKYYQLAAKQDHKEAQYQLGVCYANGIGCAKNPTEALTPMLNYTRI